MQYDVWLDEARADEERERKKQIEAEKEKEKPESDLDKSDKKPKKKMSNIVEQTEANQQQDLKEDKTAT